jgi:molybdopterin molybdotransferase
VTEFLHVITSDGLVERLGAFARLPSELVSLSAAFDRIPAEGIMASEDLPERARSTVDGYAVQAADSFGASDSIPALLTVVGAVTMGALSDLLIGSGQAAYIPTGGFLPSGADAVVMVEYTSRVDEVSIEVTRPVTSGANVLFPGEDVKTGELIVPAGEPLRPQDLGLLAGLGIASVRAYRQAKVAVISTGDEVVPVDRKAKPGQIRDANGYSISALVRAAGAIPIPFDIVPDDAGMLRAAMADALAQADVVVLSGGSSVGIRDLIVEVVAALPGAEVLAHGVAIRPGKPTLLARHGGKAIFGLPGHPVSALIVAMIFLAPFLRYIQGGSLEKGPLGKQTRATLAVSMHSIIGMEDYIRVRLERAADGDYVARPVFGKSSMLSTMARANGVIVVPAEAEGLVEGAAVDVICI